MYELIEILDLSAPDLDMYTHLNENQLKHYYEPEIGVFIAESPNAIGRALSAGYEPISILMERKYIHTEGAGILSELSGRDRNIPVYFSSLDVLSRLTGYHLTRGILGAFRRRPLPSVEEVCRDAARIAVLDHIENPTNVGAIIRSAAALGIDAVLLTPECADPLYRRAVRVSVGTVFQIPWTYIGMPRRQFTWMKSPRFAGAVFSDAVQTQGDPPPDQETPWPAEGLRQLHRLGFYTAALALREDAIPIDDPLLASQSRLALLIGNEGNGLPEETIAACRCCVRIPMSHGVDSLNAAAASAVAFWQIRRQAGKG